MDPITSHENFLDGLCELFDDASSFKTEEDIGASILRVALKATRSKAGFVGLTGDGGLLKSLAAIGSDAGEIETVLELCEKAAGGGKPVFIDDPGYAPFSPLLGVPIRDIFGVIAVYGREGGYSEYDLKIIEAIGKALISYITRLREETEARKSAEHFENLAAKLQKQIRFYESLLDNASDNIYVWNRDKRFVYMNETLKKLWGLKGDEYKGKNNLELGYPQERFERKWNEIDKVFKTQKKVTGESAFFKTSDVYLNYILNPIFGSDGEVEFVVGITRNITELKREEEALQRAMQLLKQSEERALNLVKELRESDNSKNDYLSALSHEIRNPLTGITAGISLLEMIAHEPKVLSTIEIITRQTNQLCRLVDDLLDLTRINQKKMRLVKECFNLNTLIAEVVEENRPLFEKQDILLDIEIIEEAIYIEADPVRIKQIVGNLLSNARKFTPKSGRTLVFLEKDDKEAVIRVKDTGIGIEPKELPELFKPYRQIVTPMDKRYTGIGLGLSIVKNIAELHGGKATAFSEGLGKGAEFTIRLPISIKTDIPKSVKRREYKTRALRILLIEDNQGFSQTLNDMLTKMGHEVYIAYSGAEGVDKAKKIIPDIIFLDIGLPDLSGPEAAGKIRNDPSLKRVYLVALTGYNETGLTLDLNKYGFDRHVTKPFELENITEILNQIESFDIQTRV